MSLLLDETVNFSICFLFSFKFFLHLLCISLVPLIFLHSAQILLENALLCRQNARLKTRLLCCLQNSLITLIMLAYYSAGRIYPSLILAIPSKPYSLHSVHSAIWSKMNGIISFHLFRERSRSQNNTNTVYSESVPIPE